MKKIFISTSILAIVFCYLSGVAQIRIETPALIFPEDGETEISTDMVFDWSAELNATAYQIQVSFDPDFTNMVIDSTTIYPALAASLNFGEVYYWKVRAYENEEVSDFSEAFSFTTLEFLSLDKPDAGEFIGEDVSQVEFRWEPLLTSKKQIQIDTNNSWKLYHTGFDENSDLFGMYFFDESNGWVVGEEGLLINVVDHQASVYHNTGFASSDLQDVSFHNESDGYCVGTSGLLAAYNGTDWNEVSDPVLELNGVSNLDFTSINCVDDTAIIFGGGSNFVLKSMGDTFIIDTVQYDDNGSITIPNFDINSISFQSYNNGWVVGTSAGSNVPGIFMCNDGVWNFISSNAHGGDAIFDLAVIEQDDVWFCGESGLVLHYDGETLTNVEYPFDISRDLFAVSAIDNEVVFVGENGVSLVYDIDANEWRQAILPDENDIYDIVLVGDNTGITVGESAQFFKFIAGNMPFENPTFDFIIPEDSASQYTYKNLLFGSVFAWKIRGFNDVDTSAWSEYWLFATDEFVQLSDPGNQDTIADLNPLLEWGEFEGIELYEVEVDDEPDFANPQQYSIPDSVFEKEITGLHYGATVYWRVRAKSVLDLSQFATASFTTADEVTLEQPQNMIDSLELMPTFEWSAIRGSSSYRLQYSTDSTFASNNTNIIVPMDANSSTEYTLEENLQEEVKYFWRIKAFSNNDSSAYCEPWSFTTAPPVGIEDISSEGGVRIYPNPADDQATILIHSNVSTTAKFDLLDLAGGEVLHGNMNLTMGENHYSINLERIPKGVYLLKIRTEEATISRKLIIK